MDTERFKTYSKMLNHFIRSLSNKLNKTERTNIYKEHILPLLDSLSNTTDVSEMTILRFIKSYGEYDGSHEDIIRICILLTSFTESYLMSLNNNNCCKKNDSSVKTINQTQQKTHTKYSKEEEKILLDHMTYCSPNEIFEKNVLPGRSVDSIRNKCSVLRKKNKKKNNPKKTDDESFEQKVNTESDELPECFDVFASWYNNKYFIPQQNVDFNEFTKDNPIVTDEQAIAIKNYLVSNGCLWQKDNKTVRRSNNEFTLGEKGIFFA